MSSFPISLIFALVLTSLATAEPPGEGAVQGLYEGKWNGAEAEVRVVALGKGTYRLMARREAGGEVKRGEVDGRTDKESGAVTFGEAAWEAGAIEGNLGEHGEVHIKRVDRQSPTYNKAPPEGAVVLLDGKKFVEMQRGGNKPWYLDEDMSKNGDPVWEVALRYRAAAEPAEWPSAENPLPEGWTILPERRKVDSIVGIGEDGSIQVPSGGMNSTQKFGGDFDAHVEFNVNLRADSRGQGRGNSGVYLPNGQEIQVLDSFGTGTNLGGGCGGLYKWKDPDAMEPILSLDGQKDNTYTLASLPPGTWQTYDIEFRHGENKDGKRVGLLTVFHNGVKIHDEVEVKENKGGQFKFQDHGNPVRYRNIWVMMVQ